MEKNEKIAFGVMAVITLAQVVKFHTFQKKVKKFAVATGVFVDAIFQKEVDERFIDIVEHFDEP
jgi:hypothetical protein